MFKFRRRSHLRTIILAVTAAAAFVYAAIVEFDVDPRVMLDFFLMSAALLLVAMVFGAVVAGIVTLLRRSGR